MMSMPPGCENCLLRFSILACLCAQLILLSVVKTAHIKIFVAYEAFGIVIAR